MLKGHVFKEQIFGNQVFAYFIDTFLNKKCGIGDYKNKMEVTFSGTDVTVQSGLACIRGRFIEEDTYTTIDAGTESYFCKLVIEIDLDKENTEESLNQAYYKIVKDTSNYPVLTQTDIVANNSGVYQYELARFKTSTSGISDFQDMRTYIDFDSIYAEIEKEIKNIEDGSIYALKANVEKFEGASEDGNGYCTLQNGLKMCWGAAKCNFFGNTFVLGSEILKFPIKFLKTPVLTATIQDTANGSNDLTSNVKLNRISTEDFLFYVHNSAGGYTSGSSLKVNWIAIGV